MESMSGSTDGDVGAELAAAEGFRARLAERLRLPSWFHASIGAAVAVQIATAAVGLGAARPGTARLLVLVLGIVVFAAVALLQLARFRRLNGVRLGGLASRVVWGTANLSSSVYAASGAVAIVAGLDGHWWLSLLAAAAGGAGYAYSGRRWWAAYQRDPAANARGESPAHLVGIVLVAILGLAALIVGSR